MLKKGILTKWNDNKGYGFITPVGEKKEIFVHIKEFQNKRKRPSLNQNLTFILSHTKDKACAINVEIDSKGSIVRKKGVLTKWNNDKGYGFITPVGEKNEIFVHISEFQGRPLLYDRVSFTLDKDKNGRDCAINAVKFNKAKLNSETKQTNKINILSIIFSLFVISIFYLILFHFTQIKEVEIYIIPYYILVGVLTYYIYSKDKDFAQNGNWRISESTLHFLSIFGGWTGAIIAQNILKHKSSKISFKIIFFITILLNLYFLFILYNFYSFK
ncbi:DUF1294 domain-containing protein [Sulfurovum sp.]|uniref:DUF1294 domain-containing protein n=1 Tax=Sulfurovum sp. TaxID=1969726 RepID=UPI002867C0CA|nr:DUF1294 domain-containing protein [Sulfurovum sp.]